VELEDAEDDAGRVTPPAEPILFVEAVRLAVALPVLLAIVFDVQIGFERSLFRVILR
jgi:hypothetical protein